MMTHHVTSKYLDLPRKDEISGLEDSIGTLQGSPFSKAMLVRFFLGTELY